MKKLLFAVPLVCLLAACAAPPTPAPPMGSIQSATHAPDFIEGQQWTFKRIDLWKNEEIERFSQTFDRQNNGVWAVAWTILQSNDEARVGTTAEQFDSATHGFADARLKGDYVPLKFPLSLGKTWTFSYKFQSKPETLVAVTQSARVTRWEDVTVPAGTFKTLRVEHAGQYTSTEGAQSWSGRITETFWYAPEVGRVVAQEYKDTTGYGATWDQRRDELVARRR